MENFDPITTTNLIAIGAVCISLFSFVLSVISLNITRKSFNLNKADFDEKRKNISAYLNEGYKWFDQNETFVSFSVQYSNESTVANSINELFLEIIYLDVSGESNSAKLPLCKVDLPKKIPDLHAELEFPLNFGPRESKKGWLTFKVPVLKKSKKIDVYKIVAVSKEGKKVDVEICILSVLDNE